MTTEDNVYSRLDLKLEKRKKKIFLKSILEKSAKFEYKLWIRRWYWVNVIYPNFGNHNGYVKLGNALKYLRVKGHNVCNSPPDD